jgi:dsDNA-specific endonuclease/ATPase MutS2
VIDALRMPAPAAMPKPKPPRKIPKPAADEPFASDGEPIVLEITDILDLHTFPPKEIPEIVEAYLEEAREKGFATVRIIHGKGIGVQRERVQAVLRRTSFVDRFEMAPAEAGSWGATIVWFKKEAGLFKKGADTKKGDSR